jgi:hypothetical protein
MSNNRLGGDQRKAEEGLPAHSFSFKDLGANRTVKIVVITVLMIFGTLESIFWVKVLWAKFGPAPRIETPREEQGKSTRD